MVAFVRVAVASLVLAGIDCEVVADDWVFSGLLSMSFGAVIHRTTVSAVVTLSGFEACPASDFKQSPFKAAIECLEWLR